MKFSTTQIKFCDPPKGEPGPHRLVIVSAGEHQTILGPFSPMQWDLLNAGERIVVKREKTTTSEA